MPDKLIEQRAYDRCSQGIPETTPLIPLESPCSLHASEFPVSLACMFIFYPFDDLVPLTTISTSIFTLQKFGKQDRR